MTTRRITAEETHSLRWTVLRAGLPRESAVFPGDDLAETCHLGAFVGDSLAGVVTIYPAPLPDRPHDPDTWQLRGMAVSPAHQRQGVGHALLAACLDHLRANSGRTLWCNARQIAVGFYEKERFRILGEEFEIPTAGPHFRMWRPV